MISSLPSFWCFIGHAAVRCSLKSQDQVSAKRYDTCQFDWRGDWFHSGQSWLGDCEIDNTFADKVILPGLIEAHCHIMEGVVWCVVSVYRLF
jgi:hypothetical protein